MTEQQAFFLQYLPENVNPKDTARIYFATHPADHERTLHRFAKDLIDSAHGIGAKVTVWHRNGISVTPEIEEQVREQLSSMQLVVVPVTRSLLQEPECCMALEVAYAKEHNIPILPILLQQELIGQYSLPENFGELQFLDPQETDATALPYHQKLAESLRAYIVTDEQRQRVRQAFSGYIFLSYRKKDRRAAQELMRRIHANECCRDIAIWYDEFLTPGENFTRAIQEALQKSCLFALVITPNITEPNNYVILHEYPMAQELKKDILPLECIPADGDDLKKCFDELPQVINSHDPGQLAEALQAISHHVKPRERTPERSFLLGLAYLHGIDTETDGRKAEALLRQAAEAEHLDALLTLANMYRNGQGVPTDLKQSVGCLEDACSILLRLYQENPEHHRVSLIQTLYQTASSYFRIEDYENAVRYADEAKMYCQVGYRDTGDLQYLKQFMIVELTRIGAAVQCFVRMNPDKTEADFRKEALAQYQSVERYIDACQLTQDQLHELREEMCVIYTMAKTLYLQMNDLEKAREYEEKLVQTGCVSDAFQLINQQAIDLVQKGETDFQKLLDLYSNYVDEVTKVIQTLPAAEKQQRLCNILASCTMITGIVLQMLSTMESEEETEKPEVLLRNKTLAKSFIQQMEGLFEPLDPDGIQEFALKDLSEFYAVSASFYHILGEKDNAVDRNRRQLSAAQLSFDHYPTESALHLLVSGNVILDTLSPDASDRKERWLALEEAYQRTCRQIPETPSGLEQLIWIYWALVSCARADQNPEEAETYLQKLSEATHQKWRRTEQLSDEWEYWNAEYWYCLTQEENGRFHIDSRILRIMKRCEELIKDYKQYGIDPRGYRKLKLRYHELEWLMAEVQFRYGNRQKALEYCRAFLSAPHAELFHPSLTTQIQKIIKMKEELERS